MKLTKANKQVILRYVVSSAITFFAGFSIVLLAQIDSLTVESLKDGSFIGVLFLAVRAGVKALLEAAVAAYQSYNK